MSICFMVESAQVIPSETVGLVTAKVQTDEMAGLAEDIFEVYFIFILEEITLPA